MEEDDDIDISGLLEWLETQLLGKGIHSYELVDRECNSSNTSKGNAKYIFKGKQWKKV